MATIEIKDVKGAAAGTVDVNDAVFGIEPNVPVMHRTVKAQQASWRQGTANTRTRGMVRGGPGGHGAHFHRAPGSVGQCATPSRVFKGLRLPGHMGCDTVTVKNLEVVRIDEEQNLILVKGAVPGGKNGIVRVRMA